MIGSHQHKFKEKGNYYICDCGKKILRFKVEDGIKVGVRSNGRTYTKKANTNRFFFPNEYMKFEDNLKPKQKHSIKCLLHTGARIDEIKNTKVEDFIYNPTGRSRIILRKTKTKARKGEFGSGKPRDIPLSKTFAKYLFNYIKKKKLSQQDNLNIHSNSQTNTFMKQVARKVNISNPEDFSAHTLRKTLEVWLMALGVDSLPLTAHLGHDIKTAASNYVSPDIFSWEDKNKIRKIIGDLYTK